MKLLQSWWFAALLGAGIYLATTAALIDPKALKSAAAPEAHEEHEPAPTTGRLWDYRNPDLDRLVAELKEERDSLAKREAELNDFAVRLQTERAELNQVTQAVFQVQQEIDQAILRVKQEESANLKKLAKVYAGMSAEGAAMIMREMTPEQMVKILIFMKDNEKAPILETLAKISPEEAKRVAEITEKLRVSVLDGAAAKPKTP